jgi:hypothetical protein
MNVNLPLLGIKNFTGFSLWEASENLLCFRKKVFVIVARENNTLIIEETFKKQSKLSIVCKVILCVTIILPLLALIIRSSYRKQYDFKKKGDQDPKSEEIISKLNQSEREGNRWYSNCLEGVKNFSNTAWSANHTLTHFEKSKNSKNYSYVQGNQIGKGDFGVVFELTCVSDSNRSKKAVKYSLKKDLEQEFAVLSRLYGNDGSPLEGIELPPKCFIIQKARVGKVMSKYTGNLMEILESGSISPEDGLEMIKQITQGLATLHRYQIGVFDFREQNIFFRIKNGRKRFDICDFGVSSTPLHAPMKIDYRKWDLGRYFTLMQQIKKTVGPHYFSSEFDHYLNQVRNENSAENLPGKLDQLKILN